MNTSNKKHVGRIIFAILVIFLIFLFWSYNTRGQFYTMLNQGGFISHQETFTELYFADGGTHLPSRVNRGDLVSFAFTIHNNEGKTAVYPYEVLLLQSAAIPPLLLTSGTTTLAENEQKSVTVYLSFAKTPGSSLVVVRLPEQKKEIRFHVNNKN